MIAAAAHPPGVGDSDLVGRPSVEPRGAEGEQAALRAPVGASLRAVPGQPAAEAAQQAEWLKRIASGDQRAFEALYDATLARVYALARRICADQALAEEVTEDVYVQAWRDAGRFDGARGVPLAWLLMITRSRALDALRRRDEAHAAADPHALVADEPGNAEADPLHLLATFEEASATRRALESLPARERQLVALAFMRGLTHAEIAQDTGLPLGTVKTTIRRALQTLKTRLAPHAPQSIEMVNPGEADDDQA